MSNDFGAMNFEKNETPEERLERAFRRVSKNTEANYKSRWSKLQQWLNGRQLTDSTLAQYLGQHLHDELGLSPSTVSASKNSAVFHAKHLGIRDIPGPRTADVLEIVKRAGADRGRGSRAGVRQADFDRLLAACPYSLQGLRDKACYSMMRDALLRVSEVVALNVEDIEFGEHSNGQPFAKVHLKRGKTDQHAKGNYAYFGDSTVARLQQWLHKSGVQSGPVLRPILGSVVQDKRLNRRTVWVAVRIAAKKAGLKNVATHSFRKGTAQDLMVAGEGETGIMQAGRWKTATMANHYCSGVSVEEGAVARKLYPQRGDRTHGGFQVIEGGLSEIV